jgi:hypothetical protein
MPSLSKLAKKILIAICVAIVLCAGILQAFRLRSEAESKDRYESMSDWQSISGRWTERSGIISNANYGRGDMLIAKGSQGTNYTISADIRFDLLFPETHYGDAGLVIRTTDPPEQGVDSYQGYYAGLRPDGAAVVLGRASYDWHQLEVANLATPLALGEWYHLHLSAQGCKLTVTVTPMGGQPSGRIDYQDDHCLTAGVAGLRSFYAQASWRNVRITHGPPDR